MCSFLSSSFSNNKAKSLFTLWKLGSIKKFKYLFRLSGETFGWYLFQLILLLKHDFNCANSFSLSWGDKVTTATYNFVSFILNFVAPVGEEIRQSSDQVKMRLISPLINSILRVLQRLLK